MDDILCTNTLGLFLLVLKVPIHCHVGRFFKYSTGCRVQTWLSQVLGRRKSIRYWGVFEGSVSLHICKISLSLQELTPYFLFFLFFFLKKLLQTIFREKHTMLEWTFGVNPTLLFTEMFEAKKVTAVHKVRQSCM